MGRPVLEGETACGKTPFLKLNRLIFDNKKKSSSVKNIYERITHFLHWFAIRNMKESFSDYRDLDFSTMAIIGNHHSFMFNKINGPGGEKVQK